MKNTLRFYRRKQPVLRSSSCGCAPSAPCSATEDGRKQRNQSAGILCYLCYLLFSFPAHAVDRITATLTVTNIAANNDTLTVNASVRTWKTSVGSPSLQIQTTTTTGGTATNLWNHLVSVPFAPFSALIYDFTSTNIIKMLGGVGQALTVTPSGTWASVTYSTQVVSSLSTIRVPGSALPAAIRVSEFSLLTTALNDYSTNSFAATAIPLTNFFSKSSVQTGGNKTITNSTFTGGQITNSEIGVAYSRYYNTNAGIWFYNSAASRRYAIAPGIGGQPSIYDIQSDTTIAEANAANYNPQPGAILNFRIATNSFGQLNNYNLWTHTNTFWQITNTPIVASAITLSTYSGTIVALTNGLLSGVAFTNSISTNATFRGTNTWTADLSYTRANVSTLANGNNSGLDFGTTVYVKLKAGPTGAFAICGITGGRDGRTLMFENATGQVLTLANESGVDAVPANRITTGTGADVALANRMFGLIYDSEDSRWKILWK